MSGKVESKKGEKGYLSMKGPFTYKMGKPRNMMKSKGMGVKAIPNKESGYKAVKK